MGCNIIWTGWHLISESVDGLMDRALTTEEHDRLQTILDDFDADHVRIHSVRTRVAGHARYISMHVLQPATDDPAGHDLVENLEQRLVVEFEHAQVITHMEPIQDPRCYEDDLPGVTPKNGADRLPTDSVPRLDPAAGRASEI